MPFHNPFIFPECENPNARLWRYMELPRFLSVLNKKSLFFPSVATLAEADSYEGEPSIGKVRAMCEKNKGDISGFKLKCEVLKHLNFVNCWHMNDDESYTMWEKYAKGAGGVAIQTTMGRLRKSISKTSDRLYIGKIVYDDNNTMSELERHLPSDYMRKRRKFHDEREVRIVISKDDVKQQYFDWLGELNKSACGMRVSDILMYPDRNGIYVNVDLSYLVEKIVTSPNSLDWVFETLKSTCRELGSDLEFISSKFAQFNKQEEWGGGI